MRISSRFRTLVGRTLHAASHRAIAGAVFSVGILPAAFAAPVLEIHTASLTTYLPTSATARQNIRPSALQRGVHVDGTSRWPSAFGWAMAANPGVGGAEAWNNQMMQGPINLATGGLAVTGVDLALPSAGPRWIVGRSYNGLQESGGARVDSNGPQGKNWSQISTPEILLYSGATSDKDVLYIVYGADRFIELKRTAAGSDLFKGVNGATGVAERTASSGGSPELYTYTDQLGNTAVFFGSTNAGVAAWQLWKVADEAGNTAYIGDASSAATAITAGFDATSGLVTKAYDAAGRRFSYTYTTIDSSSRLTSVKAETKTGGTWSSPTGVAEVGRVDYAYYSNADNVFGDTGNLKLVTTTTPLTDPAVSLVRKTHYRYYKGTYNASTNPGLPNTVQMVVAAEGYRKRDWLDSTFNDTPLADTTADLKPYADTFLEYDSTGKISKAWFNGECGCSGGTNGTHQFAYTSAADLATRLTNTQYDEAWGTRTVITKPDGSFVSQYLDEVGQPLSRVVTASDPGTGTPDRWVTEVVRSVYASGTGLGGLITEIRTPAANNTYTHSTGVIAAQASAGLVTTFTRPTTGDLRGLTTERLYRQGTGGTSFFEQDVVYTLASKTFGSHTLVRPLVSEMASYTAATSTSRSAGTFNLTTWSRTMWTLVEKTVTQTAPAVSAGNNGSGTSTTTARAFNADGTASFDKSADGIISYRSYADGQVLKSIQDADTTKTAPTQDFHGVTIPTGFGSIEVPAPRHLVPTMTYDAQRRVETSTAPDGRVTKSVVSKLADGRMVQLSIPRWESSTGTSYGPVQYTVSNLAGGTEVSATLAFTGGTTTVAPTSWISTTTADPISAVGTGTVTRLSTSTYSNDGHKQLVARSYHTIPASLPGTTFDETAFGYDSMGRRWRTKAPTGTISRTVYDVIGRMIESWSGTNDRSFTDGETTGTDNMTKTSVTVYDGGAANGNSLPTTRTVDADGNWATTTDQRVSQTIYDFRNRPIVQIAPVAPHTVSKLDNLGRVVAVGRYSSSSGLGVSTDPTTTATNRVALSETFYDELGRVWKSRRHAITLSTGASSNSIDEQSWFDPAGRVIKTSGDGGLFKHRYDQLGRKTHQFTLAKTDDTTYDHAYSPTGRTTDVAGDTVLEESQSLIDAVSGKTLASVSISRHWNDTGSGSTTGPLDTNADGDPMKLTAANVKGRVQITAMWYDSLDRVTDSVSYGTNGIVGDGTTATGTFTRTALSVPARSDTALRTTRTYDTDGSLLQIESPGRPSEAAPTANGVKTRFVYDAAGRQLKVISNYDPAVNSGNPWTSAPDPTVAYAINQTVAYEYTAGLRTKITAKMPNSADDQVTTYTYGTTKTGANQIASGHLLREVKYPDSASSADVATTAYNALGQPIQTTDQAGNIIASDYDLGGRLIHRRATTIISGFDANIQRISTTFDTLGRVETVTQYTSPTVGSGTAKDQIKYTYDDWGHVSNFEQDVDSVIGGSGYASFNVSYTTTKAAPSGAPERLRITAMSSPGLTNIAYHYSTATLASAANRVSRVKLGANDIALYEYNGVGQLVDTYLVEPDVQSKVTSTTLGSYPGLDSFNRIIKNTWTKNNTPPVDFYSIDLTYDRSSNITSITDNIHKNTSSQRNFDAKYSMDDLSRLLKAEEGTYASGSISNPPSRQQTWILDHVGNQTRDVLDLNGDGNATGTGEYDDDRTYNKANEILTRSKPSSMTPAHDAVGNMTDDGQNYTYVYDVFGRLTTVKNRTSNNTIALYSYNGLGYRISWTFDNDWADPDCVNQMGYVPGVVDACDAPMYFAYDTRWRIVASYQSPSANIYPPAALKLAEAFLYHNSGLAGRGGSSYIDAVILRDRDRTGDATLEERRYFCQNWRADVSAVLTATGEMAQWAKYSAYGVPIGLPAGDTDSDGDFDAADDSAIMAGGTYDVRKDVDLNGTISSKDVDAANSHLGTYYTLGRGSSWAWVSEVRKGYAGYEFDPSLAGAKWHVRHRVLNSELGRWTRRDPLGYVDDFNLFNATSNQPVLRIDADGRRSFSCLSLGCSATAVTYNDVQATVAGGPRPPGLPYIPDVPPMPTCTGCSTYCSEHPGVGGVTLCQNGQPCVCICDYIDIPGFPPDSGGQVETIVGICIRVHEYHHFSTAMCLPISLPGSLPGLYSLCNVDQTRYQSECEAHNRHRQCLQDSIAICASFSGLDKARCQARIAEEMRQVDIWRSLYCSCATLPFGHGLCNSTLGPDKRPCGDLMCRALGGCGGNSNALTPSLAQDVTN